METWFLSDFWYSLVVFRHIKESLKEIYPTCGCPTYQQFTSVKPVASHLWFLQLHHAPPQMISPVWTVKVHGWGVKCNAEHLTPIILSCKWSEHQWYMLHLAPVPLHRPEQHPGVASWSNCARNQQDIALELEPLGLLEPNLPNNATNLGRVVLLCSASFILQNPCSIQDWFTALHVLACRDCGTYAGIVCYGRHRKWLDSSGTLTRNIY